MKETHLTNDLAKWSKKAQSSKGGTVLHHIKIEGHLKKCGCLMGDKNCRHPYKV